LRKHTFMQGNCHKADEVDLAAVLTEPQNPEWEAFRQHYPQCVACSAEVYQWTNLENILRTMGKEITATHPSEERLEQFQQNPGSLPLEEQHAIQQHLQVCPACKEELSFDFSPIQKWIDEEKLARARPKAKAVALSQLIIQVAHNGLSLLESHLTAPFLGVQESLVPMPAYRREEVPPALNLRLTSGQVDITAIVRQEGKQIALTLTLLSTEQGALAGQQVFLRRRGRAVFSAQTDSKGVLRMPRLKPGIYEVACPGIQATFELEFRS
jgi:hypothetical protein